jgi:hypothetical protein
VRVIPYVPHPIDHMGDLVTNAKKVTVSVLYWYEKLSSLLTEIFKMILKRIENLFFIDLFSITTGANPTPNTDTVSS